jgi:colanic acid/amylovoran biosynthesis glycosyltransferase
VSDEITVSWCAYDWRDNVSGPSTWLARLLPLLRDKGVLSIVELLIWDEPGPLTELLQQSGIECHIQKCSGSTEERVRGLISNLQTYHFDVFLPNLVLPALFSSRFVQQAGIPSIGVLHSDDGFYNGLIETFLAGRKQDALSTFVAVSSRLSQLASANNTHKSRIVHIPYGVPIPETIPGKCNHDSSISIVYAGRLSQEQKRIREVANAMKLCVQHVPGCKGVIIGDGPERERIEKQISDFTTAKDICLLGRVLPSEVQSIMQDHDAILLLSDYEGLPIALLEGMACGLVPIVTPMDSGIPELIQHGINGLIVQDRTDAVVGAVRQLSSEPDLKKKLSHAAQETVARKYSNESSANNWTKLLRELHQKNAHQRKTIRIPRNLDLPKIHPATSAEDPRAPAISMWTKVLTHLRRIKGKLEGRP